MHRQVFVTVSAALVLIGLFGLVPAAGADEIESGAPYVPSPHSIVARMLELAGTDADDYLIDLGSGDGRIVLTAAKTFGARGLGVELREDLVARSRRAARLQGVEGRARFEQQDLFKTDLSQATIVTVYLLPETLTRLRGKLLAELAPDTLVLSHDYPIDNWRPERFEQLEHPDKLDVTGTTLTNLYLYRVPADVDGAWQASLPPGFGMDDAELELAQVVASATGRLAGEGAETALEDVLISGRRLSFRSTAPAASFTARVEDGRLQGYVQVGGRRLPWSAVRR